MVGWYHTHPDWGVFLSSMDLFICEHFFNKPLDVAIVLDPIREERGIFHWEQSPERQMSQAAGFYLTSSRLTQAELQQEVIPWGASLALPLSCSSDSDDAPCEDSNKDKHKQNVKGQWPCEQDRLSERVDPS
jgi:hypothetical protein